MLFYWIPTTKVLIFYGVVLVASFLIKLIKGIRVFLQQSPLTL